MKVNNVSGIFQNIKSGGEFLPLVEACRNYILSIRQKSEYSQLLPKIGSLIFED